MRLAGLVAAWVAGLILAAHATQPPTLWLVIAGVGLIGSVAARRAINWRWLFVGVLAFGLGAARQAADYHPLTETDLAFYNDQGAVDLSGVIVDLPETPSTDTQLRVQIDTLGTGKNAKSVNGLALVTVPPDVTYAYGDRVSLYGEPLTPPTFDSFDYAGYLANNNVFTVLQLPKISITDHNQGAPIPTAMAAFKAHARDLFNQWLPSPQSALLSGIVLGLRTDLPTDVRNAFDQVNATRVLVIDGAKMAIFIGLLTALLGKVRQRWLSTALILAGVAAYTLFVGAQPPVVRAAIMGGLAILAQRLGRESNGLSGLAFAVWLQTALDPAAINDAAFWISATSTLGLVIMAGPAQRRVDAWLSRWFSRATVKFFGAVLIESILVTLVVYAAALPVMLYVFGRFSPIGTLVNILITPAQAPVLALGIPAIVLGSLIAPLGQLLAWIASLPVSYTLALVRAAAQTPNAALPISITPAMVGAFYAIGFGLWLAAQRPPDMQLGWWANARRLLTVPMVAAFGLSLTVLLWTLAIARPDGRLHIWFLDIADSAVLIQTPGGAHILIDGGAAPNRLIGAIGDRLPFGIRNLDALIVTQPKSSLISALPPTLARYPAGVALTNGQASSAAEAQALASALATTQTQIVPVTAGYRLQTGDGVALEILSPMNVPDPTAKPEDGALAVRLSYGSVSFVLTSDLTALTETDMIRTQALTGSVLELPSHGSDAANADDFLKAIAPQVAVIEVTTGARGGQPADATLKRLGTIPVYRTDQSGTLAFTSDGHLLWVSTDH